MNIYVAFSLSETERNPLTSALPSDDTVIWAPDLPEADRKAAFLRAEVVFGNPPAEWWTESKNLRWVQLYSAGFDPYLALDWSSPALQNVTVCNLRGFFGQPVAETAVAGIMALYRKLDELVRLQSEKRWVGGALRPHLYLLHRKQVVVLGGGAIGQTVQKILGGFDCEVTVVSRSHPPTLADLDSLLPNADIVVATLPETEETRDIFSEKRLSLMKPSAILVNVGRGSAVDEPALIRALQAGRLAGAVLDVTEVEPLPTDSPLWTMPNVLLSQHTGGGYADENADKVRVFLRNLERYRAGEPLEGVVGFGRGY